MEYTYLNTTITFDLVNNNVRMKVILMFELSRMDLYGIFPLIRNIFLDPFGLSRV